MQRQNSEIILVASGFYKKFEFEASVNCVSCCGWHTCHLPWA